MTRNIQSFISSINESLNLTDDSSFRVLQDFHISLSQTVVLQHHWIEPLVESLQKESSSFPIFNLTLQNLEMYSNEDKTRCGLICCQHFIYGIFQNVDVFLPLFRSFLGIKVDAGHNQLNEMVGKINTAFQDFKLSSYFKVCNPFDDFD